jgi:hypothetical protein
MQWDARWECASKLKMGAFKGPRRSWMCLASSELKRTHAECEDEGGDVGATLTLGSREEYEAMVRTA